MTPSNSTDRNRWIALYVLCVGVLMMVLDVAVVTRAAVVSGPRFSHSSSLGRNALPDLVRRPAASRRPVATLSAARHLHGRIGVFTVASPWRQRADQELLVAVPLIQRPAG